MRRTLLLAGQAFVAGITACRGDDRVVVGPVFTAAITGAVSRPAAGTAFFGVMKDVGTKGFTVVMEEGAVVAIVLQTATADRPLPGSYPIVPKGELAPAGDFRGVVRYKIGAPQEFEATSGTLTVTESGPEMVEGTMNFRAVRTSPCCDPEPVTIDVMGAFTAGQVLVESLR